MKHWCFYANVVRYLDKLEANAAKKKPGGAYLVWSDDEGPHMIAGPDIDWHRGAGPMPDIEGLNISARPSLRARNASDGSASARSTPTASLTAARVSKRSPSAALSTRAKANKRRTTFPKPAQSCSPKHQRRGRKSTLAVNPRPPPEIPGLAVFDRTLASCSRKPEPGCHDSASHYPHLSPPHGRSTREARHYFVALARRAQRTVRVRLRSSSGARLVLTGLSCTLPRHPVRNAAKSMRQSNEIGGVAAVDIGDKRRNSPRTLALDSGLPSHGSPERK